nr:hypothetical protein [Tanacetum cinerariifolium]
MRRIYNDEGRQKTYFRSRGNTNMAFDLRSTEDVLPWPGNANIAFDLRPTEDVTDMSKVDKIEAKRTKPGMGMIRVQEINAEGKFISNLIPLILYPN